MNISKKLLVVGLLVTGMAQAFTLTEDEKGKAAELFNNAVATENVRKEEAVFFCKGNVECQRLAELLITADAVKCLELDRDKAKIEYKNGRLPRSAYKVIKQAYRDLRARNK